MGLHELTLRNFRLFSETTIHPDADAITVFLSQNGTGKTSVLEAVHALATASSFRTTSASDMIRTNQDLAEVHGVIFQEQRRIQVDLTISKGLRNTTKRMLVNGQRPRSRADLSEALPLTVFTPEGVEIIRQGPEGRRTFLTTLLTDVDLSTGEVIERFHRILTQRNALLRRLQDTNPNRSQTDELEIWTEDFITSSEQLVEIREETIDDLREGVGRLYQELAQSTARVGLEYERSWEGDLRDALHETYDHDRVRGYTTIGPHRDDLLLSLDGRDARRQASQGEQRSMALALRLAGHELVRRRRGLEPLLLLDDVFSELDPLRSHQLLRMLPVGQTLVTTASPLPEGMQPSSIIDLTQLKP